MKALIVDDEPYVSQAIQMLIPWKEYGITNVYTALSVSEGLRIIEAHRPEIAFVDIMIGNAYGNEIIGYIQSQQYNTKVIAISCHDDFQFVRSMFIAGSIDYLMKPLEREELLKALGKAISLLSPSSSSGLDLSIPSVDTVVSDRIYLVKEYLTAHYNQRIRLTDLETLFYLNKDYMCRHFHEVFGTTITSYLQELRIKHAMQLLQNTDMTYREIAEKVGFSDAKYFSKVFQSATGRLPSFFRKGG